MDRLLFLFAVAAATTVTVQGHFMLQIELDLLAKI
jgi:hypothetical protein